jgi:hypothetical protein
MPKGEDMRKLKHLTLLAGAAALLVVPAATQALKLDRDRDGLPDRWEKRFHLSTKRDSTQRDPDRDRVDNRNEFRQRTSPRRRDTDRDGRPDGREDRDRDGLRNAAEDATGNDPIDRDTDDDGIGDGDEQAGVVASFEGGILTIDLAGGGSVSGRVTDETEIECEDEDEAEGEHGLARAAHDGGDNSGPGSGDGDDNSGPSPNSGPGNAEDPEDEDACPEGTAALVPGARVHEAELEITAAGAVWEEVELLR